MSLCESEYDCAQKSLEQLVALNRAITELQQQVDKMAPKQHGQIYYLMSEIAVLYVLYLLRKHLTLPKIIALFRCIDSLYQRISFRARNIMEYRSRSTWRNENVELEERSTVQTELPITYGTRDTTLSSEYTTISIQETELSDSDEISVCFDRIQRKPVNNEELSEHLNEIVTCEPPTGATIKVDHTVIMIPDAKETYESIGCAHCPESSIAAKRPSPNSVVERTVSSSETARSPGSSQQL